MGALTLVNADAPQRSIDSLGTLSDVPRILAAKDSPTNNFELLYAGWCQDGLPLQSVPWSSVFSQVPM